MFIKSTRKELGLIMSGYRVKGKSDQLDDKQVVGMLPPCDIGMLSLAASGVPSTREAVALQGCIMVASL
jgi:hypothetical protein